MSCRLYVGNLSFSTTEEDLKDYFSKIGAVTSCNIITDKFTNKSRGFGFVEMASNEDAQKAISEYNGKEFQDRTLTVNEAKPREDRPPRGGGDRGFGGGPRRDRDGFRDRR